ncbi:MAG: PBSX family phage terminase large subunit [Methyloceanibacter sp.]|nr:PBSX family phage terminase large subunit [Methyloceanibacter sp.]
MSANPIQIPEAFRGLFQPARYKAYYGGRGSAKSHSMAAAAIITGAESPLRFLCAREVQKSIKDSVKQLLDDKIEKLGYGHFYTSTRDEIRGLNGSKFLFAGLQDMSVDQIKSFEGVDRCWVEEAQTISERSIEVLVPTIREPGSELWFSWNPRHAKDPVDRLFRGEYPPEDAIIQKVNYDDNPFFPPELERERQYDKKAKPERYGHIWEGDYEPMAVGAIWTRLMFHEHRKSELPVQLTRILVAVDPAVSSLEGSNEHGIIVGGLGTDGRGYILEDGTCEGGPEKWSQRAVALFDKWQADGIVIEKNQGGDMCRHTLKTVRPGLPIIEVHATRGKHVRAEPIAAHYAFGRVSHVGTFEELETQMCQVTAAGFEGEGSPDRCDALVWLLTHLFPGMTHRTKPQFIAADGKSMHGQVEDADPFAMI